YYVNELVKGPLWKDNCLQGNFRWIIIVINITFQFSEDNFDRHSNVMIVDTKEKTIRYFEPNGPMAPWFSNIEKYLETKFAVKHFPGYRFISTSEFCPEKGPQAYSVDTYCAAYSLFLVWATLTDPEYNIHDLIKELLKENKTELRILIEKFIQYLYQYAEINGIFDFYEQYQSVIQMAKEKG